MGSFSNAVMRNERLRLHYEIAAIATVVKRGGEPFHFGKNHFAP
jgi:hypothetical protein